VALARTLLIGGALWIMDEPGSNLDARGHTVVAELLQEHLQAGGIAVVATHQGLGLSGSYLRGLALQ
jgi:heme exporter protein A